MTIYKDNGIEIYDCGTSKFLEHVNECDRRDVKLKEAEKTIANKDVIIQMLQNQVKKLEESYKQNVKQAEEFRYRYCLATEKMKQMQFCPNKKKEKQQKQACKTDEHFASCNTCIFPHDAAKCQNAFLKNHYIMLQTLVDQILRRKHQCSNQAEKLSGDTKENEIKPETKGCMGSKISELQSEINKLKDENGKLQEQIEFVKESFPLKLKTSVTKSLNETNLKDVDLEEKLSKHGDEENEEEEKLNELVSQQSLVHAVDSIITNQRRLSSNEGQGLVMNQSSENDLEHPTMKSILSQATLKKGNSTIGKTASVSFVPELLNISPQGSVNSTRSIAEEELFIGTHTFTDEDIVETKEDIVKTKEEPVQPTSNWSCVNSFQEIKDKISLLVEKQEITCKELGEVKNQIEYSRICTEKCNNEILKLKETVQEQKDTFMTNFKETTAITNNFIQVSDNLSEELKELRNKIGTLYETVEELKQSQKTSICPATIPKEKSETEPDEPKKEEAIESNSVCETELEALPDDYGALEEKYSELKKQALEKDQQIKCLNELINYYNKLNEEMLCLCPALPTNDPQQNKNSIDCECSDDTLVDKTKEEKPPDDCECSSITSGGSAKSEESPKNNEPAKSPGQCKGRQDCSCFKNQNKILDCCTCITDANSGSPKSEEPQKINEPVNKVLDSSSNGRGAKSEKSQKNNEVGKPLGPCKGRHDCSCFKNPRDDKVLDDCACLKNTSGDNAKCEASQKKNETEKPTTGLTSISGGDAKYETKLPEKCNGIECLCLKNIRDSGKSAAIKKSEEILIEKLSTFTKKSTVDSMNVKSHKNIKSMTPCFNLTIEKSESNVKKKLSIEDIYQAVRCSRRHKKESGEERNECTSSVSSSSVGNCLLNCDGCVCDGSLQFSLEGYVNYLHEQLQVISTIENQIENLRDDIKF